MLNVSIVIYNHSVDEIEPLIKTLTLAEGVSTIFLIDNSEKYNPAFEILDVNYIFTNKNIGYGAAHNIALRMSIEQNIPYHLVINPDIEFKPEILAEIKEYMDENSEIGHVMPKIFYPNGEIQYLCKLLPTPFDLLFRRFLPTKWSEKRMNKFELRHSGYNEVMDVPYLSGCFMFLRVEALKEVGVFDERFFMYPEDIDLTRRIHRKFRTVFYPKVSIIHQHGHGSYKSVKMMLIHINNLIKYFNKWGWLIDKERTEINTRILKSIESQNVV